MAATENFALPLPQMGEPADIRVLNRGTEEIDGIMNGNRTMFAPAWVNTETYHVGSRVVYLGEYYKCKADNVTGAWDSTKWDKLTVGEDIEDSTGGASALADLDDVEITSPTQGQALLFDDDDDVWKNQTLPEPVDVEANPSASATANLSKLKVGSTVYGVSGLPSTSSASNGDVLTLASGKVPTWASPAVGGDGVTIDTSTVITSGNIAEYGALNYTATQDCFVAFLVNPKDGYTTYIKINNVTIKSFYGNFGNSDGLPYEDCIFLKTGQTLYVNNNANYTGNYHVYGVQEINSAVVAQLNAMKTGFDGVEYSNPGEAVRSCDNIIDSKIVDFAFKLNNEYLTARTYAVGYYTTAPVATSGYHYCNVDLPSGTYESHGVRFISQSGTLVKAFVNSDSQTFELTAGNYYISIEDTKGPFYLAIAESNHGSIEDPVSKNNISAVSKQIGLTKFNKACGRSNVGLDGADWENAYDIEYLENTYLTANGGLGTSTGYGTSGMIPVNAGDSWLWVGNSNVILPVMVGYSTKEGGDPVVLASGVYRGYKAVTIPDGVNYIRASFTWGTNYLAGTRCVHKKNVYFFGADQGNLQTFLNAIKPAMSNHPSPTTETKVIVYILPGTYTTDNWVDASSIGVTVPRGLSLVGMEGAEKTIIECTLTSNSCSTLSMMGNTELKGLTIRGSNCRYAIHDDYDDPYLYRHYEDCIIESDGCSYGFAYGGGCKSGCVFTYDRCIFRGKQYMDGAYEMHSNTGFDSATILSFNNCIFQSDNGHDEKAFEIRGLGDTTIVNRAYLNNSKLNGCHLQKVNSLWDWEIGGAGNSLFTVTADAGCELSLYDSDRYTS